MYVDIRVAHMSTHTSVSMRTWIYGLQFMLKCKIVQTVYSTHITVHENE